jgi:NADPH:quinone reductase-like Zn-dependent oxidoreductase
LVRQGGILVTIAGRPDDGKAQERGIKATSLGPVTESAGILRQAAELFDSGKLKPHVREVLLLADAARAQAEGETGHGRGHIVLKVAG